LTIDIRLGLPDKLVIIPLRGEHLSNLRPCGHMCWYWGMAKSVESGCCKCDPPIPPNEECWICKVVKT